jgi:hypothetical protein
MSSIKTEYIPLIINKIKIKNCNEKYVIRRIPTNEMIDIISNEMFKFSILIRFIINNIIIIKA